MNDNSTHDMNDVDRIIFDYYNDIGESVFKGHDQSCKVFVDMRGDFKLLRICSNEDLNQKMTTVEYQTAVIEAVNDAIEEIKRERINIIGNVLNIENGEY